MSTEVAKKRGRPKKVITESVEVNVPESAKKATTRAKSTKAAPKTSKATTSTPKTSPSPKSTPEPPAKPAAVRKPASKTTPPTPPSPTAEPPKPETKPSAPKPAPKVTPETSKILNELRQQTAKNASEPLPSSPQPLAPPTTSSAPQSRKPLPSSTPKPAALASKIPLAGLNKKIVGDVAGRAGARPNTGGPGGALPKNYKSVANKVTMTMVALPIAVVTSWVLYERLVLGEERKLLVKPETPPPEEVAASTSS